MTWLVTTSLRLRVLVLAASVVLIIVGVRTLETTPLDVFPEFAPPLVEIQTEAPGLSTEEVESLVTMPLKNALNGTPWLKTIRSKSVLGLSSIVLIFQDGTDLILRTPTGRRTSRDASEPIADDRASSGDALAVVVDKSCPEDRHFERYAFADGNDAAGAMDDSSSPDVGAWRGERCHLGAARPPVPGARRSRTASRALGHAWSDRVQLPTRRPW